MTNGYEWVLKIKDQFSAPLKGMVIEAAKLQAAMHKNTGGIDEAGKSINGLRSKLERLEAARDGSFRTDHIRKYNGLIEETKEELQKLENLPKKNMPKTGRRSHWGSTRLQKSSEKYPGHSVLLPGINHGKPMSGGLLP